MTPSLTLARPKASQPGDDVAARHWAWCAPFLATDRVRISRDGGRTYPRTSERQVTHRLPEQPAALRIYDRGVTRVLVADFDASKRDRATVDREADAFIALVRRCGGRTLTDRSPTGGRHVYVPLTVEVPWALARRIALTLEKRYRTFDKMPMINQTDGLIRPPGSPHPSGGWQELLDSREEAISALSRRTNPVAFEKLARALGVDPSEEVPVLAPAGDEWLSALGAAPMEGRRRRRLAPEWELMGATGVRPSSWPSDSEARLALLRACARHGWVFSDVVARYESGDWPGLIALYERYQPQHARTALARDWRKALAPQRLDRAPDDARESTARRIDTRDPLTHPQPSRHSHRDDPYALLRDWWTVLKEVEKVRWSGRAGLSTRRVLRAIGAAAQMRGSTTVAFGVRSLAEGSGLDHSTVAKVLAQLREEDEPFIVRVQVAEGLEADVYELRVPDAHEELTRMRWRSGRIRSVHPLFRHLGGAAFLVWEVLEAAAGSPVVSFDISAESGVPVRTVQESLAQLGELGLVERTGEGWSATGSLDVAAVATGADEAHAQVVVGHRRDRAQWRGLLKLMPAGEWWREEPPPEDLGYGDAEMLLAAELGAEVA